MSNTFMNNLKEATNYKLTENGAVAHKSTMSAVYDMFAFGGAYRKRTDEDCILLFRNAYKEDPDLALKCLFYLRDCRGGQGERRFFRLAYHDLCTLEPSAAYLNLEKIPEFGRWDDLVYIVDGTPLWHDAMVIIAHQLNLDLQCQTPSLLAKWLPSENASSAETKRLAASIRISLKLTHKKYRKVLSVLRKRINVVERLMSTNQWDKIEFDKIPSKAGLIYKNAFARREILAKKYEAFAKSAETTVNAKTLYPYEIAAKALERDRGIWWYDNFKDLSETDRLMIQKYWDNQPDYLNGEPASMLCIIDTSGSMTGEKASAPINVATSLGIYCAERMTGPFAGHYISFASKPQLIKVEGVDFVDKCRRIVKTNLVDNTNLEAAFDLILQAATMEGAKEEDIPKTIVVISDMEIDSATRPRWTDDRLRWTQAGAATAMENIKSKWAAAGLKCPKLVYWNVDARHNTILDRGEDVSFVSGCSPVLFEQIITGVSGYDLMLQKLNSERYAHIFR